MNFAAVRPTDVDLSRGLSGSFYAHGLEGVAVKVVSFCQQKTSWTTFHPECLGLDEAGMACFPSLLHEGYVEAAGDNLYRITYKFLYEITEHINESS